MAQQLGAGFGLGGGAQAGLAELLRRDFEKREIARREAAEQERARSNRAQEGFLGQRLGLEERGLGLEERGLDLREQDLQSQLSMRDIEKTLKTLEAKGIISDQEHTELNRTLFKEGLEGPFGSMLSLAGALRSTGTGVQAPNLADPTGEKAHARDKELIAEQGKEARLTRATPTINLSGGGAGGAGRSGITPSVMGAVIGLGGSVRHMRQTDSQLTQLTGPAGKVQGGIQKLKTMVGLEPDAIVYDAVGDRMIPQLARAATEVGNLAREEQRRYEKLVPRLTDPLDVRMAKYDLIEETIGYVLTAAELSPSELAAWLDQNQGRMIEIAAEAEALDAKGGGQAPSKRFELIP